MKKQTIFIVFCLLSLTLASCKNPEFTTSQANAKEREEEVVEREFAVYVDCSRSLNDKALKSAVRTLLDRLPRIIEKWDVTKLHTYCFGQDGWTAEQILSRDLPRRILSRPQHAVNTNEVNEVTIFFPQMKKEKEKRRRDEDAKKEAAVQAIYRQEVKRRLSGIDYAAFLPPADFPKASCTDINGALRRISNKDGLMPAFVAMITDGAESCKPALKSLPPPKNDLSLVFILVPESGNTKPSQQQFETREKEILSAIPWAHVVPYFQEDLSKAFDEAHQKH